jgi:hypothetical protein
MRINELPDGVKQKLREVLAGDLPWENIQNLTLEELDLWVKAKLEDLEQALERKRRRRAVEAEIGDLARSVSEKYPDLPLWKVEYFLHGEVRKRFQELMREIDEMSRVPLVTRNRQPWHQAVEEEIDFQLSRGPTDIDSIADAVVKRDRAYPPERVREYTAYILETSAGLR